MKKLIILGVLVLLSPIITVKAEYKIHDGRPFGNPIMDSGATPRYTDTNIKYYDIAIPYDTSIEEIGGYATGIAFIEHERGYNTSKHYSGLTPVSSDDKLKITKGVRKGNPVDIYYAHPEGTVPQSPDYNIPAPTEKQYGLLNLFGNNLGLLHTDLRKDGGNQAGWNSVKDIKGNIYNLAALGQGLLANKEYGWESMAKPDSELSKKIAPEQSKQPFGDKTARFGALNGSGLLFDVILKDGTQIHCAMVDLMGTGHSIGGINTTQDGLTLFGKENMNYGQYRYSWYGSNPFHLLEIAGTNISEIRKHYNINSNNPVCYIRIWNTTLWAMKDTGLPVASGMEGASSKLDTPSATIINGDNVKTDSTSTSGAGGSGSGTPATPNGQFMGGIISEDSLATVTKLTEVDIHGMFLEDAKEENLEQEELEGLITWKRNIKSNARENGIYKWARIIMVWAGLLFILWGTLLYIAYWVDRVNGIYFFNFVGILTLGKLQISDTEDECTFGSSGESKTKTINHRVVIFISLLSIFFGSIVITGYIYSILSYIIHKIISILS